MSPSMEYVLITGTNGGLGLGICTRLLDDFLQAKTPSTSLTLVFTTRSTRKGAETLRKLQSHLSRHHPHHAQQRIHLQPETLELTNLLSIRALAHKLLASSSIPKFDAIILNAGIGGWSGLNWPMAIQDVFLRNIVTNTTWPRFKLGIVGLITAKQSPETEQGALTKSKKEEMEPPLGQVFCANVFGHYMLAHWLMPLLCACEATKQGRIVWVSSIETRAKHFTETDLMGLRSMTAYESSKRLTDLLALTYDNEVAKQSVQQFTTAEDDPATTHTGPKRPKKSTPIMHTAHPGICATSIVALPWIMQQLFVLSIFIARLIGSPWATISTYVAAQTFTWLVLAPSQEIKEKEGEVASGGRVKWGTAVGRLGNTSVRPTEVEGWGIGGSGDVFGSQWWGGGWGRAPGARDAKREDVEEFVVAGGRVWAEMEELRREWEERVEQFEMARGEEIEGARSGTPT